MAHNSLADPQTSALMNDLFVNIKAHREQPSDVDAPDQTALPLIAGTNMVRAAVVLDEAMNDPRLYRRRGSLGGGSQPA